MKERNTLVCVTITNWYTTGKHMFYIALIILERLFLWLLWHKVFSKCSQTQTDEKGIMLLGQACHKEETCCVCMAEWEGFLNALFIEASDEKHGAVAPHQHLNSMKYIIKWNQIQLTRTVSAWASCCSFQQLYKPDVLYHYFHLPAFAGCHLQANSHTHRFW